MHHRKVKIDFGVLQLNGDSTVIGYLEKPTNEYMVSMGIYVFEPAVVAYVPPRQYLDFPDLVKLLMSKGEKIAGFPSQDYWLDIGRREDYELAQLEYNSRAAEFQVA